ncbi:MAG: OmpH family outer membrane protein [Bacteroidales bacterium]|nr:OmpH family outer membrane protein [Bacteroidales bacterium]
MEEIFEEKNEEMKNEVVENEATVVDEKGFVVDNKPVDLPETEEVKPSCEKKCNCQIFHWILEGVLLAAVIALFILHFMDKGGKTPVMQKPTEVGTGEVVYINIDSVNEKYEMVKILKDTLEAEQQKQEVIFNNRQKALENKAANFEKNYSSGSLTPQQAQYAQQSLQEESTRLQRDYSNYMEDFQARYAAALEQMADSLNAAAKRVNAAYNASYIFTYQDGGQLLYADPAHDITNEVIEELNKSFKKKK